MILDGSFDLLSKLTPFLFWKSLFFSDKAICQLTLLLECTTCEDYWNSHCLLSDGLFIRWNCGWPIRPIDQVGSCFCFDLFLNTDRFWEKEPFSAYLEFRIFLWEIWSSKFLLILFIFRDGFIWKEEAYVWSIFFSFGWYWFLNHLLHPKHCLGWKILWAGKW